MSDHALQRIPIFARLGESELAALRRIAMPRRFPTAETIFWQEDPSDALYVIVSGFVKAYSTTPEGKEKILTLLGPGEFVGEIGLLDGRPRSATVETLTPLETLVISRRAFRELALEQPEMLWKILAAICEKLRQISSQMLDASYLDVHKRLINTFLMLADKHGEQANGGVRILRLPHREMANMIGSNRETVTRLMKRLEERGLVSVAAHHIDIPSVEALRKAADEDSRQEA